MYLNIMNKKISIKIDLYFYITNMIEIYNDLIYIVKKYKIEYILKTENDWHDGNNDLYCMTMNLDYMDIKLSRILYYIKKINWRLENIETKLKINNIYYEFFI